MWGKRFWLAIYLRRRAVSFQERYFLLPAEPVAERLRVLFLNHSIISPLCLVWVRAPLWPHVRQASAEVGGGGVNAPTFVGTSYVKPYLVPTEVGEFTPLLLKPSSACGCARWFFSGSARFRPPTDWPVSYELK